MNVLDIFAEINKVPRPSKHEEKMCEWLLNFAKEHQLECQYLPLFEGATTGNIIMRKPATAGYEGKPGVILQAHMDMVCEKNNDCQHDFMTDPIETYVEDGWLHAKGTTLGADNGIGVAMALAILTDDTLQHPALEALFTTDEETGLTGANCMPQGALQGKRLINLDNEDDGQICIGCCGGVDTLARLYYTPKHIPEGEIGDMTYKYFPAHIKVTGLMGGHSGEDINKGRGNAVKILTRLLFTIVADGVDFHICTIQGGNLRNAIAREAEATILVPMSYKEKLRVNFNVRSAEIEAELTDVEHDLRMTLESCPLPVSYVGSTVSKQLIQSLYACPHGMQQMSPSIPGLVQTSTNLASIKMKEDEKGLYFEINTSQRSSVESEKHSLKNQVECALALAGAEVTHGDGYPGWNPNPTSELLKTVIAAWEENEGKKPQVVAIHAGLECGLFLEKYPDLDMVAFGPQMSGVHSPAEKVNLDSIDRTYRWLITCLRKL